MKRTPLAKSFAELSRAKQAHSRLKHVRSVSAAEEAWNEGVCAIERGWKKVSAELRNTAGFEAWNASYVSMRRTDELLQYIAAARNAQEHTIEESVTTRAGSLTIGATAPSNRLYIKHLVVAHGHVHLDTGGTPAKVEITPPGFRLLPICNRGATFPTPGQHLGRPIRGDEPRVVLGAAIAFYIEYVRLAADRFGHG